MRSGGFSGSCVRDSSISLPNVSCADGQTSYIQTRGYRKVASDVCVGGLENTLGPVELPCCMATGT